MLTHCFFFLPPSFPNLTNPAMAATYIIGQSSKVQYHWFRTETNWYLPKFKSQHYSLSVATSGSFVTRQLLTSRDVHVIILFKLFFSFVQFSCFYTRPCPSDSKGKLLLSRKQTQTPKFNLSSFIKLPLSKQCKRKVCRWLIALVWREPRDFYLQVVQVIWPVISGFDTSLVLNKIA
jgi:hypothetical protein